MSNQNLISPLLSICIPTYNRANDFERMFKGVLPQLTNEVEIVVRDDGTSLDTKVAFDRIMQRQEFNHQYIKGNKIGLDAASIFLIEKAKGKFIWFFSDDDEMRPGAVAKILQLIKAHQDMALIWVNYDFERLGRMAITRDDGFFKDGNEVLETVGVSIGYLTSLIFKRESALPALEHAKKYIAGFSFAFIVPILDIISSPGRFYFLRGPYILCHPTTGAEFKSLFNKNGVVKNDIAFNSYGVDFYNIIMAFKGKFDDRVLRKVLARNFGCLWRGILVGWVGGWDTPQGKRWRMLKIYWSFPQCWIALACFIMPLWVNQKLYDIYKVFFYQRKFIFSLKRSIQNEPPSER